MSAQQFVVFDAEGNEIDWIDPYVGEVYVGAGRYLVYNGHHHYLTTVPDGGRFEIREMES